MLLADEELSVPNRDIRRSVSLPLLVSTGLEITPQSGSAPNISMLSLPVINDQPGAASGGSGQVVSAPVTPPAVVIPKLRRSGRVHAKPDRFSPY